jgi:hypothetical protein
MASTPKITIGAINIAADPHPTGIYWHLFQMVAEKAIPVWGKDWAKITEPQDRDTTPPSFFGRILVWTEIEDGKWLDQETDKEATPDEKDKIQIPEHLRPNFRSFNFVFLESKHLLVLEYINELGEHFGSKRAQYFFTELLSEEYLGPNEPDVSVTVVPSREALSRIYAMRLRRLEIFVVRPNADDLARDQKRLLDRLMKQGAKSQNLELKKRAKVPTIIPDDETQTLAQIAAAGNGHVTGEGTDADGKPTTESTKDHPKTVTAEVEVSSIGALFNALRRF